MSRRNRERTNLTVLIIGEGAVEEAFLKHLKSLFVVGRNPGISVCIVDAAGDGNIVRVAEKRTKNRAYDKVLLLRDNDREMTATDIQKARSRGYKIITSDPCIEAFLLQILRQTPPRDTDSCKRTFHPMVGNSPTDPRRFGALFPKGTIENNIQRIPDLKTLISYLIPPEPKE